MNSINSLGIRIAGITLICVLVGFGIWKGIEIGLSQYNAPVPTVTPSAPPAPTAVPDTAGSPITPQLQQEISRVVDTAQSTLTGYTKKYIESLPENTDKGKLLDPKKLEDFVNANKGVLLPELFVGTVQTTTATGKQAIQTYLDSISPTQNTAIKPVTGDTITTGLAKQASEEDPKALSPIRESIESNFNLLKQVKTPKESLGLHTKLLQATLALMNNVKLLQGMQTDFVGGLIGQKNLADLNAVFTDIGTQILALETKYNIK